MLAYIARKYEALKAWTLDGQVFYRAVIIKNHHTLMYRYDTFFYVMILAALKFLSLNNLVLMETPDNIVTHASDAVNIYAFYQNGKIHGVLTRGLEHEQTRVHPVLYVMIDNVINVTHEFEYFKRYINAMELTAIDLMELLWVFKHRHETYVHHPPMMTTLSILYDHTYQEQVIANDDVVLLA
jgi:hypothetical protein